MFEIDFSGIDYVIMAFLNPIIGDLILQKEMDAMKSIDVINGLSEDKQKEGLKCQIDGKKKDTSKTCPLFQFFYVPNFGT